MISDIRALFCKWTPWERQLLARLSESLAPKYRSVLQAQAEAVTKIQRIIGWTEIDLYVVKGGRVCWDDLPQFPDLEEFQLAKVKTLINSVTVNSELFCIGGHLFSIESDLAVKPYAFRNDLKVEVENIDRRYVQ